MATCLREIGTLFAAALLSSVSAFADVIHVRADATGANDGSTWADAFRHLQDALAVAQSGDEVWVAIGEYRPDQSSSPMNPSPPTPGDRDATFQLLDFVAILGGFDGTEQSLAERAGAFDQTVLTGDLLGDDEPDFENNDDNSSHVTTGSFTDATAILDGFTVTAGHANMIFTSRGGAGLLIQGGSPSVANVTFRANLVSGLPAFPIDQPFGGAVFSRGGSSPTFEACSFIGNMATDGGAVDFDNPGTPVMRNCVFRDNVAFESGGALWALDCNPTVTGCLFEGNVSLGGAGAIIALNSPMTVSHSRFIANSALAFGAIVGGELTVSNSLFSGNTSDGSTGAISATNATLTNVTIHGNTAATSTGGVSAGSLTIANSIVWGNTDASGAGETSQLNVSGELTVDHSCIEGWSGAFGGIGNTGSDPAFVDADGRDDIPGNADDDLRLSAGSPLIDAADCGAVPADADDVDGDGDTTEPSPTDLRGHVRFWEDVATPDTGVGAAPIVDMGGYEFHGGGDCQIDLGFQGPGNITLNVCGADLTQAGGVATLQLAAAPALGPVYLFIGFTNAPTPTLGGTLVPTPLTAIVSDLQTDIHGILTLPVSGVAGLGATVFLQAGTQDGAVTKFSNAVQMDL